MDALERQAYLCALAGRCDTLQNASLELIALSTRTRSAARAACITNLILRDKLRPVLADPKSLLAAALDSALEAAQTTLGNVQLLDHRGVLRIHAQRGFATPFLEFFEEVRPGVGSACAAALMNARQVVVRDVRGHPLFRGRAGELLGEACVAAVVSSPIMDPRGKPLGVLSVHHRVPGGRSLSELMKLHHIARRAGVLLEQRAA
jgi:GAF domain-containing protein